MAEQRTDVLVAGYPDPAVARRDFDVLAELVRAKKVQVEGIILVTHDSDGNVTVVDTGDHVGRKGAGWGGGVGVLVGPACVHVPASLPDPSGTRGEGCGSTLNGRGFMWCYEENAYVGRSA